MAAKPKKMDTILELLKLHESGLSIKAICRQTGVSINTLRKYLRRLDGRRLSDLTADEISSLLKQANGCVSNDNRLLSLLEHFNHATDELKKTGVTRQLLWREYIERHPDGYRYSQYCDLLRKHLDESDLAVHLEHTPGLEMMMDFAGAKLHYLDHQTGEVIACQVLVVTLPFSGFVYCEALHSQKTEELVTAINRAVCYYGGVSKIILTDNLSSVVSRSNRYEPSFVELCRQLGNHYNNVFQATRPARPTDKGMVEGHVKIVYNHIYGPLRNKTFYSLQELNKGIREQLDVLNDKAFRISNQSRRQLYEQKELPFMLALPSEPFLRKNRCERMVQRNYHIQLGEDRRYYSVPYSFVGKRVMVLYDLQTVEIYHDYSRIALHQRTRQQSLYHTTAEHMPSTHRAYREQRGYREEDFISRAEKIGPCTSAAIKKVLKANFYPEQNYKSCQGLLMLERRYGTLRLEEACRRVLTGTRVHYTIIKNVLAHGLDKQPEQLLELNVPIHENIRGSNHYH